MTSLFNLTGDYLKIKELAEQGADPEAIEDAIAYIDDEIEDKADGYAYIIRQLDGNKEAIDKEIKRLQALKKTHTTTQTRLKDNLYDTMKTMERPKFKTAQNSFYVKKTPVKLVLQDTRNVPDRFYETERKLNTTDLKTYLKENEDVRFDGVGLEQGETVVIK